MTIMKKDNQRNGVLIEVSQGQLHQTYYPTCFFDVDSCITQHEGIDELGRIHGKIESVAALTKQAMEGVLPFDEVFGKRLELIQPRVTDFALISDMYLRHHIKDARDVFYVLQSVGVTIHLLSGGFDAAIMPLAEYLGIPQDCVHANTLFFDERGKYRGYDSQNVLSRKRGKKLAIDALLQTKKIHGPVAIVGDAVSELETATATDLRIGFGGFVQRKPVMEGADVYLPEPTFAPLIPLFLDRQRINELLHKKNTHQQALRNGFKKMNHVRFNVRARELKLAIATITSQLL